MRSAAPARTRPNSPMRTHGSGGSLCGYACGRMRGRLDTHLGAGTASADARSEAPDPCRHAALSAVQHSPSRTRNARSASCCAACSVLLAVACATACGTTQRWPPARADALRGIGKAARRAGGRRSGKRATAARGARGLHDPPNKKLITCIWVGVFETHCCCSAFLETPAPRVQQRCVLRAGRGGPASDSASAAADGRARCAREGVEPEIGLWHAQMPTFWWQVGIPKRRSGWCTTGRLYVLYARC